MQLDEAPYPADDIQAALYTALRESPYMARLFAEEPDGVPIFDMVPQNQPLNYLTIDESQVIDDSVQCGENNYEVFATIHIFSREYGTSKSQLITGAARHALLNDFTMDRWNVSVRKFQTVIHQREPDGITKHAILVMRYLVQQKQE